jgi:ADP-ribose pyrophosphatase YjhB (NUDIX family)
VNIVVRPTGILIRDGRLLLVRQRVDGTRDWSLPGGALEPGETIERCLKREMKEETGLDVGVRELLYLSDRHPGAAEHVVHVMFLVAPVDDAPLPDEWTHEDPAPSATAGKQREIKMVPLGQLTSRGFPLKFQQLALDGFPGRGSYAGDFNAFFGEAPPDER